MFRILRNNYKISYGKISIKKPKDSLKSIGKWALYWLWILRIHLGIMVNSKSHEKATLILLSYKRIQNIEPIIKAALKCSFIDRIIVSNNNPDEYDIHDWMVFTDPRVVLINQKKNEGFGNRWNIAINDKNDNFILIDDDIFIKPKQLKILFEHLISNKNIPHGLAGSINFKKFVDRRDVQVEILHQIYAVTRDHIEKYFEYKNLLEQLPSLKNINIVNSADDIIISFTGNSYARIYNTGIVLRCPFSHDENIASYLQDGFYEQRKMIIDELNDIKSVERKIFQLQNSEVY